MADSSVSLKGEHAFFSFSCTCSLVYCLQPMQYFRKISSEDTTTNKLQV